MGRKNEKKRVYGKAARRRQRSRRRYTMYCMLAVVMMLCIVVVLSLTVFFNISEITIEGESRYTDGELIAASGVKTGDNLFCLLPANIQKAMVKTFPYIESVSIKRALPDRLIIKVKEAECDCVVEWQGEYYLLSDRGRVLESGVSVLPEGEQRVIGFDMESLDAGDYLKKNDRERFGVLREIKLAISEYGMENISVIALENTVDLNLLYDGRIIIKMGNSTEIAYKINAAQEVIELSDNGKTVAVLDVSTKPAMRLRETDIYTDEIWPFSDDLLDDYKRVVSKPKPQQPMNTQENNGG